MTRPAASARPVTAAPVGARWKNRAGDGEISTASRVRIRVRVGPPAEALAAARGAAGNFPAGGA